MSSHIPESSLIHLIPSVLSSSEHIEQDLCLSRLSLQKQIPECHIHRPSSMKQVLPFRECRSLHDWDTRVNNIMNEESRIASAVPLASCDFGIKHDDIKMIVNM